MLRLDTIGSDTESPFETPESGTRLAALDTEIRLDQISATDAPSGGREASTYIIAEAGTGEILLHDSAFMLQADYTPVGHDLMIEGTDGTVVVIVGYYDLKTPADLVAPNGNRLEGDLVQKLAGPQNPGELAQNAAVTALGAEPIGEIKALSGTVTIQRADGTTETVAVGDPVFQNDVVSTGDGATIGILFADGTVFNLESDTRMVLDEFVYEPGGDGNSLFTSLVEGTFSFVSGQITPDGEMEMRTPVATLGIRGTWGGLNFAVVTTLLSVFNFADPATGVAHEIALFDDNGQFIGASDDPNTVMQFLGDLGIFNETSLTPELVNFAQRLYQGLQQVVNAARGDQPQDTGNTPQGDLIRPFDSPINDNIDGDGTGDDGTSGSGEEGGEEDEESGATLGGQPPNVSPITAPNTDEDATVVNEDVDSVQINLLGGQSDPEGLPLDVGNQAVIVSDIRTAPPNLPVSFTPAGFNEFFAEFDPNYFDYLAVGEEAVIIIAYNVVDNDGFRVPNTATIIVEGRNDGPVIVSSQVGADGEEGETAVQFPPDAFDNLEADGTLDFFDVDLSDTGHTSAVDSVEITSGTAGGFATLDDPVLLGLMSTTIIAPDNSSTDGTIDWAFLAGEDLFDYLKGTQFVELTYTISVTDTHGAKGTQTVIVTIGGANDAPFFEGPDDGAVSDIVELASEDPSGSAGVVQTSGELPFTDIDAFDTGHTDSITGIVLGGDVGPRVADDFIGTLTLTTTPPTAPADPTSAPVPSDTAGVVAWEFNADELLFDYLGVDDTGGQALTITFTVQIADPDGATDETTITITVLRANDAPVFSDAGLGAVADIAETAADGDPSGDATGSPLTDSGVLNFVDIDLVDNDHVAEVTDLTLSGDDASFDAATLLALGLLTVTANPPSDIDTPGTVDWGFSAGEAIFDGLADGESLTLIFEVTVRDRLDPGGVDTLSDTTTVEITVAGANDGPFITSAAQGAALHEAADTTGSATPLAASGLITFTDVDLSDSGHTASMSPIAASGLTVDLPDAATLAGFFSLDPVTSAAGTADGSVGWNFSAPDSTFDYLPNGVSVTLKTTVTITDPDGVSDTQDVAVEITGRNDAPSVTPIVDDLDENEFPASGVDLLADASASDPDHTDVLSVVEATLPASVTTAGGRVLELGTHFTVVAGVAMLTAVGVALFDDLSAGETDTGVFDYEVTDGIATIANSLTVNILGTNDEVIVTPANPVTTPVDTAVTFSGEISVSDVDSDMVTVTLEVENGTLDLPGLAGGGLGIEEGEGLGLPVVTVVDGANGTSMLSLFGPFADINGLLAEVTYTPNGGVTGADVLTITANDGDGSENTEVTDIFVLPAAAPVPIEGGPGDDVLVGTPGIDLMLGHGGNDEIDGLASDDQIFGGSGNDKARGGGGNDVIEGGRGNDDLEGNAGDDTLIGNGGEDFLKPGTGNDTVHGGEVGVADDGTRDWVSYRYGIDQSRVSDLEIDLDTGIATFMYLDEDDVTVHNFTDTLVGIERGMGTSNADTLIGSSTAAFNHLRGREGDDDLTTSGPSNYVVGGAGTDTFTLGTGFDFLGYDAEEADANREGIPPQGVTVNLTAGTATDVFGDTDTFVLDGGTGLSNVDGVEGTSLVDTLIGDAGRNVFYGNGGNDAHTGNGDGDDFGFAFVSDAGVEIDVGIDTITDYTFGDGDRIRLSEFFEGTPPASVDDTNKDSFVRGVRNGSDINVEVDRDGAGTDFGFEQIATLTDHAGLANEINVIFDDTASNVNISVPT